MRNNTDDQKTFKKMITRKEEKHDNLDDYEKEQLNEKIGKKAMSDNLDYDQKEQSKESEKSRKKEMRDNLGDEKKSS